MKLLAIGDIFGRPGREALAALLPGLIREHGVGFVVVNGENAAGGKGITCKIADELFSLPIDVITSGNHIWEKEELIPYLDSRPILRPHNVDPSLPGKGWGIFALRSGMRIAVVSLQGVVHMEGKGKKSSDPFQSVDALIADLSKRSDAILIDFHAEATSEKRAIAWYVNGRVTALVGTHTHVQTADESIMSGGTAYISDLGMTGPHDSVIGLDKDVALHRFLTGDKRKFKVADAGVRVEGVVIDIDDKNGHALSIVRIKKSI